MRVCQGHCCHNVAAGLPVALYGIGGWNNVVSPVQTLTTTAEFINNKEVLTCDHALKVTGQSCSWTVANISKKPRCYMLWRVTYQYLNGHMRHLKFTFMQMNTLLQYMIIYACLTCLHTCRAVTCCMFSDFICGDVIFNLWCVCVNLFHFRGGRVGKRSFPFSGDLNAHPMTN